MPDDQDILELRPPKKEVDFSKPYNFLHEKEVDTTGKVRDVNTIFLTNRECPFKCLMCDLWKHTLDEPTPAGAIPRQIAYALEQLPEASVIKLYNNGNFFDTKAIPEQDYEPIAGLLSGFDRVIVENHPNLCGNRCLAFRELLNANLEIAMGLETIHPEVLPRLNKQITMDNFKEAAGFLTDNEIGVRAFILLNPPYLKGKEKNITWTVKSTAFAFDCGADACSIIPTRGGNGIMDKLERQEDFIPPTLHALESAYKKALQLNKGRVFVDLWDLKQFSTCAHCFEERKNRLQKMNIMQEVLPDIECRYH